MEIRHDTLGQPFIQWEQAKGSIKRAWIQRRSGATDWAGCGRYLSVARWKGARSGGVADFPIFSGETDETVLMEFVTAVNQVTGCEPAAVDKGDEAAGRAAADSTARISEMIRTVRAANGAAE